MNVRVLPLVLIAGVVTWVGVAADSAPAELTQEAFLARVASAADAPFVLDVRTPDEFVTGYVPGAVNIPHDQLASRLAEVPRDKDVVLYCRSGRRALMAAETLGNQGYTRLQHLEGDITAWQASQRPVEMPRDPPACAAALKAGQTTSAACRPQ